MSAPALDMVNRIARGLGVNLAKLFAPLDEPYRPRFRKPRRRRGAMASLPITPSQRSTARLLSQTNLLERVGALSSAKLRQFNETLRRAGLE